MVRETQDYAPLQQQATKNNSHNVKTLKWIYLQCDFPCHFKVNWDKLAFSYHCWKYKRGKRLTITTNFYKSLVVISTALDSGKNLAQYGLYHKKLDWSRARD